MQTFLDRQLIAHPQPWTVKDAVWGFRATGGLPQYWLKKSKAPQASVLTTTRSSGIILPNAAGVFQSLGNNVLPRTDRGLYANGQIAALNENGNIPQGSPGWGNQGGPTITTGPVVDGFFQSVYVASTGGIADRRSTGLLPLSVGVPIAIKIKVGTGQNNSGNIRARFSRTGGQSELAGTRGAAAITSEAAGTITIIQQTTTNLWVLFVPNETAEYRVGVGPNSATVGQDIRLDGIDVTATPFVPEAWVSNNLPAPTLLASDVRAVAGVRPSDAQPEPFPGWEAAGLDGGFAGRVKLAINRLSAASIRTMAAWGSDADNCIKLTLGTDNIFRLTNRKAGVNEVVLATSALGVTGPITLNFQAKPGAYSLTVTGVTGAVDSDTETLPAPTTMRLGSDFGTTLPWNGWIEEAQVVRAA